MTLTTITVSPGVLDRGGRPYVEPDGSVSGWQCDPGFLVRCDDVERGAAAVHKAGERMMTIDERGRTLDPWEMNGATYTPNYYSGVYITEAGLLAMYLDTKGELSREMGEAMVFALVQELTSAGVDAHIAALGPDVDLGTRRWNPPPSAPRPEPIRSWYIARTVWCTTTDGRDYQDREWRRPDGTWTWDRAQAENFDDAPMSLVDTLRAEGRPPLRGEVNGLWRPIDTAGDDEGLPPRDIRQPR